MGTSHFSEDAKAQQAFLDMIRKSVKRFSEKIGLKHNVKRDDDYSQSHCALAPVEAVAKIGTLAAHVL
ncbi:hypothetical protein IVB12_08250 [Bradyrhizobium sp. 179]|uniref:hypothetical protein n=1 Tax=Bradyrhizobium sp. 179 TaxID=2782648 RepID=UPI001FF92AFE|nr:hypothetical protein [Bradyrhizobium sp. 179]MCK1541958.1 hypothetical protein [Bradyrhizobium sp. 179]